LIFLKEVRVEKCQKKGIKNQGQQSQENRIQENLVRKGQDQDQDHKLNKHSIKRKRSSIK
jgi:hypothetical protein